MSRWVKQYRNKVSAEEANSVSIQKIVSFPDASKAAVRGKTKQDNLLRGGSLYTRTATGSRAKWRLALCWAIVGILLFRFLHTVPVKSLFGIIPRTITYLPPGPPWLPSSFLSFPLPPRFHLPLPTLHPTVHPSWSLPSSKPA